MNVIFAKPSSLLKRNCQTDHWRGQSKDYLKGLKNNKNEIKLEKYSKKIILKYRSNKLIKSPWMLSALKINNSF